MKLTIKQNLKKWLFLPVLCLFLFSCANRKEMAYFSEMDRSKSTQQVQNYEPKLMPDDRIEVFVAALDMQAVAAFNGVSIAGEGSVGANKTYLIDKNGFIEFPIVGNVKLAGMTRLEATELLKEKIGVYVKEPIVNLKIVNFKVTVLGEVNNPGTFQIDNERITLLEALGLAGDIGIQGVRENVLIIREDDGKRKYITVDLTTDEVFNSPAYYLTQNDVVYVEPNKSRINQSKSNMSTIILPLTAVLLSAVTTVVIVLDRND